MGTVGNDLNQAHDLVSESLMALEMWHGEKLVTRLTRRALEALEATLGALESRRVQLGTDEIDAELTTLVAVHGDAFWSEPDDDDSGEEVPC